MPGPLPEQQREARKKLEKLFSAREHGRLIHYSCESFDDRESGQSPRVTSIAVRRYRPAVLMAAEADASREGVRAASESGEFGKLKNGYSQDGPILYNGFSVVEQAGPHGESTFYNKHDLLRNAVDRSTFDHVIESDKPISITIGSNGVSAHSLNSQRPDLHVFRDGKEETLSAGFSQTGKLHDYGAFVGQETTADGHKSVTMFSKKELFEHRTAEEVRALQDAIKHHQSVTIDLSHNAVSIQISERITHANTPARTQSITRKSSSGLERGEP